MAKDDIIDEHVSLKQCKLAVDALIKHAAKAQEKREETELLPGREQYVWLVTTVKQMHPERKLKPFKIPITHPLVDPRTTPVCLITKDPQREYKDLLDKHGIRFISRVVGIEKLKGKFKPFEARRMLLKENGLFLADERVVPLLPGLLGKKWFDAKKQPIPVNLTRKDLKGELERAISSTYFHQNQGTCSSVKVGTLTQSTAQVLANLKTALPAIVKAIKGGWDNIQSLHIKTSSSMSLPIWSCELGSGEGGRWDGLDLDVEMASSDEESGAPGSAEAEESDEDEEMEVKVEKKAGVKGKKRAAEVEEVEEKPKKKVKAEVPATAEKSSAKSKAKAPKPKPTPTPATSVPDVAASTSMTIESKKAQPVTTNTGKPSKQATPPVPVKALEPPPPPAPSALPPPSTEPASDGVILPTPQTEVSTKKKRRKSQAQATPGSTTAEAADASSPIASAEAPSAVAVAATPAPVKENKRKRKKALAAAAARAALVPPEAPIPESPAHQKEPDTSTIPAVPVTPTVTKKKNSLRASAVDFFEDAQATPIQAVAPPPPNTPADGLVTQTPVASASKKRRKAKGGVEATPISGAIEKLLVEAPTTTPAQVEAEKAGNADETPAKKKKPRHKKRASAAADGVVSAVEETPSKVPESAAVADEPLTASIDADIEGLSIEELKQKRSATAVEKKKRKDKEGKGKKVKEALIGKKGLTA